MPTKQDIELALRASDTTTKKTFGDAAAAVNQLTTALQKQIEAAEKGEVSAAELKATMDGLKTAGAELAREQGIVETYAKIASQLSEAELKARDARTAFEEMKTTLAGQEAVTNKQQTALDRLGRAADNADKKVNTLAGRLGNVGRQMEAAGLETANLAEVTARIGSTFEQAAVGIRATSATLEGYEERLLMLAKAQREVAEAEKFEQEAAANKRRVDDGAYVAMLTDLLNEQDAALRANAEAQEIAAQQAAKTAQQMHAEAEALDQFYAIANRSLAGVRGLDAFRADAASIVGETSSLKQAFADMAAPAAAAMRTIDGLGEAVAAAAAEIGEADKPLARYKDAIATLGAAQRSLLEQAGAVDAFRNQETAVRAAEEAYTSAEAKLREIAGAMRTANAPSKELATSLREQEKAVQTAGNAVTSETEKLHALSAALQRAGIDSGNLAAAENKLRGISEQTGAAIAKYSKAAGGEHGASLFGLNAYQLSNIGYQLNDVFAQLASGTNVMQIFAQQGGQILQVFPEIFAAVLGALPEIALIAAAFGALYEVISRIVGERETLREFAATLQVSVDGTFYDPAVLGRTTQALADLGFKLKDARAAVMAFVRDGYNPDAVKVLSKSAADLARTYGIELPDAARQLSDAFKGNYDDILKLNDSLNFLTETQAIYIRNQIESGHADEARAYALELVNAKIRGAAETAEGPAKDAFRNMGAAFKDLVEDIGHFFEPVADIITKILEGIDAVTKKLPSAGTAAAAAAKDAAAQGLPGPAALNSDGNLAGSVPRYSAQDLLDAARTVVGEAQNNPQSMQAVAEVIRNRSQLSGENIGQVVRRQGQFASVDDPKSLARLNKLDENSPQIQEAMQALLKVLTKAVPDITGGATNFFTTGSASAKRNPGVDIGGNTFRGGSFPGMTGEAALRIAETNKRIDAENRLHEQMEQNLLDERASDDANKVAVAGLRAYRAELKASGDEAAAQAAKSEAERHEAVQVAQLRARQVSQLVQEEAQAQSQIGAAQDKDLAPRLQSVEQEYQAHIDRLKAIRARGGTDANLEAAGAGPNALERGEAMAKQERDEQIRQAGMKFFEQQMADAEAQRADLVKQVNADYAQGNVTLAAANKEIEDGTRKLVARMEATRKAGQEFQKQYGVDQSDPKVQRFNAAQAAAPVTAQQASNKAILEDANSALADAIKGRDDAFKTFSEQLKAPGANPVEILKNAAKSQDEWNAKIAAAAKDVERLATELKGLSAGDADTARGKAQQALAQTQIKGGGGTALGSLSDEASKQNETELNKIVSERGALIANIKELEDSGAITAQQAQQKTKEAYTQTQAQILQQVDALKKLYDAEIAAGQISKTEYDADVAGLAKVAVQTQYVNQQAKQFRETLVSSFAGNVTSTFDTMAAAIGRAVAGTERWNHALADVGRAAVNFFAQFLKDIADAILKMEALKVAQSLFGQGGIFGGLGQFAGLTAGASALTAASAPLNAAAAGLNTGGAVLGSAAALWQAIIPQLISAATELQAAASTELAADLAHSGGVIGAGNGGMRRTGISSLAFVGAPRYHKGGTVGLANDEQATILQRGEKVLTVAQQKAESARLASAGGGTKVAFRHVLVQDKSDIASAMAGSDGEQVTLTHVKNNASTIRQILRVG